LVSLHVDTEVPSLEALIPLIGVLMEEAVELKLKPGDMSLEGVEEDVVGGIDEVREQGGEEGSPAGVVLPDAGEFGGNALKRRLDCREGAVSGLRGER
jgi:hypothetical protein